MNWKQVLNIEKFLLLCLLVKNHKNKKSSSKFTKITIIFYSQYPLGENNHNINNKIKIDFAMPCFCFYEINAKFKPRII